MTNRKQKPRGVGRPSLSGKGPARRLEIKVPHELHARIEDAAVRTGVSVADWLREAAELALARGSTR